MRGINNGYDRWLTTPPDDNEPQYCEYCNKEMEYVDDDFVCTNKMCPSRFGLHDGMALKMARRIVDLEDTVDDLHTRLKHAEYHKKQLLGEINELQQIIKNLTLCQGEDDDN